MIEHVVGELRATHPDRIIESRVDLKTVVDCDRVRVSQLLSNLVANALTHGTSEGPVRISAEDRDGRFELSVSNPGRAIPDAVVEHLFKPFVRNSAQPGQQGLGLGLYIASEIARAHGGRLDVFSRSGETRFTFSMPVHRPAPAP